MKNKVEYIVLLALTFAMLVLPAVQQHTQWFKMKPLNGVTVVTERPKLNIKTFMSGEYQRQGEQYLSENIGFREPLTRLYNQLSWSLFRYTPNKSIFVDDDNWIFNDFTIKHYYGQSMYDFRGSDEEMVQKMADDAKMLYLLQNVLKEYGVTFFVCLAPGKDMVCAEHVPQVNDFSLPAGIRAIDYYPPVFDSLGINYIDFSKYYMDIRDTVSYPLYLKSSSHWSNQAAVYAADSLFHYMEELGCINIHDLLIGEEYVDKTHFLDADLEEAMNLIWPIENDKFRYNSIGIDDDTTAVRPKWLIVGDSYYQGFMYNLDLDLFFQSHHYWYYNAIVHDDPLHNGVDEVDILRELLSNKMVMLIYSPCNLYDLNRHFLTRSLFSIFFDDDVPQEKLENIKQDIRNTPEWYASIEQKAIKNGRDVELELEGNARYLLYNSPGIYFNEFNATEVPTSRNSRIAKVLEEIADPRRENLRQQMMENPEWMNSIREKAQSAQITIEEAMEKDIDWLLQNEER